MADFLLGAANTGTLGNPNGETAVTHNYAAFVRDDWRISSKLTWTSFVSRRSSGPGCGALPSTKFASSTGSDRVFGQQKS